MTIYDGETTWLDILVAALAAFVVIVAGSALLATVIR
jgi:hypothetical protein